MHLFTKARFSGLLSLLFSFPLFLFYFYFVLSCFIFSCFNVSSFFFSKFACTPSIAASFCIGSKFFFYSVTIYNFPFLSLLPSSPQLFFPFSFSPFPPLFFLPSFLLLSFFFHLYFRFVIFFDIVIIFLSLRIYTLVAFFTSSNI